MIQLIALDLDGTLLRDDKSISAGNKKMIKRAMEAGVHIVICTGRPIEAIEFVLDELGINSPEHYSITYNGGLVLNNQAREIIAEGTMTLSEILDIYEVTKHLQLPLNAIDIDTVYEFPYPEGHPSNYFKTMPFLPFKPINFEEIDAAHAFYKVVMSTDADHLAAVLPDVPPVFFERYSIMRSHPHQLEMMRKGVDKGFGLSQLAKHLGIPRANILAMGDEENDVAMLQWAGEAAVMANARHEVKKIASYLTDTNMNDGVAKAIGHFVFGED